MFQDRKWQETIQNQCGNNDAKFYAEALFILKEGANHLKCEFCVCEKGIVGFNYGFSFKESLKIS